MKSQFTLAQRCVLFTPMFVFLLAILPNTAKASDPEPTLAPPPPHWAVQPENFQFNMNMVIRIQFDGAPSNDSENIVGAFVDGELRGVATQIDINGEIFHFLTVYSNVFSGETITFRAYYKPEDKVYAAAETEPFGHNCITGDLDLPFWINLDPNADFPPDLLEPLKDTTLVGIPFDLVDLETDYLISADGDPVTWNAEPGLNLNASIVNGILTVTPVSPVWIGTDTVRITVTETTPNQHSASITACFTVLADYGQLDLLPIPPQTIFIGGAFTPFDLDNFLDFNGPCHVFDFDVTSYSGSIPPPGWLPVTPGPQSMKVVARPLFADETLAGPGAVLAAFVNNTLVGIATPTGTPPNVSYTLDMKNVASGPITFQLYHAENQYLYEKVTALNFLPGGTVGTVATPYTIQLSPLVPTLAPDGSVDVLVEDPTWVGVYPVDFIAWDCNYPNTRRDTSSTTFSVVEDNYPHISSPPNVDFEENACTALYDAETTDPNDVEGMGLTYFIDGGADATFFDIDAITGELTWKGITPDFENPLDADGDNKYEVGIRVVNMMGLADILSVVVTVTDNPNEPFAPEINGGDQVCLLGSAVLTTDGGGSYLWSTTETTASITVNAAGTYTVTVTNTASCTATAEITITEAPTITATGSNAPVCQGASISLTSTPAGGSGTYSNFAWAGPNAYSASVEDPAAFTSLPAAAGTYTVTVTDDAGCSATATATVEVSNNNSPSIIATSNSPVCEGTNLALNSTPAGGSGNYTTFRWTGPDGYAVVAQTPLPITAEPLVAGLYTVELTDDAGCTAIATTNVVVYEAPIVAAENNGPVCIGGGIVLISSTTTGGSGNYTQFAWTGPNAYSSALEDPYAILAEPEADGTYDLIVTDDRGCTGTNSTTVIISTLPEVLVSTVDAVCDGGTMTLTSTVSGGSGNYISYAWSGPNFYFSLEENPAPFPATMDVAGTYSFQVMDDLGCVGNGSADFAVNPVPSITAANNAPICSGKSLTLSSTPSGGSGSFTGFLWSGPDNYVATLEDPASFTTTSASNGIYEVVVTDSNGCTGSGTTEATVKPSPEITASSNSPVCTDAFIDLFSNPTGGSGTYTSFVWTGPDNFMSTDEDPLGFTASIDATGFYEVVVTDDAACTASAFTGVAVSIYAAPTVVAMANGPVCVDGDVLLTSSASGGSGTYASYQWSGPDNYSAAQQNPTPFPASAVSAGSYTVTVTDTKGCGGTSSVTITVNAPTIEAGSNSPVCGTGDDILLMSTPDGGTGVYTAYNWSGPDMYVGTGQNPAGFASSPEAAGTYTVTVTDDAGCTGTGTTTVQVGDLEPPTIDCPTDMTLYADDDCTREVGDRTGEASNLTDDCTPPNEITVIQTPVANTALTFPGDIALVTLTADDGNGHTTDCSFMLVLQDTTPPEITCLPIDPVACVEDVPDPNTNTTLASDNCGGVAITYVGTSDPYDQLCTNKYKLDRIYKATDPSDNFSTCVQVITVFDDTPPVFTAYPADETVECNVVPSVGFTAVEENCNSDYTVNFDGETIIPGSCPSTYTIVRQWTAADDCGNASTVTQRITVQDTEPPVFFGVSQNVTVECNDIPDPIDPTVLDNCDSDPSITYDGETSTAGTCEDNYTLIRQWTAADNCGNTVTITQSVVVQDLTPPAIDVPAGTTITCSDPVPEIGTATATDNCDTAPDVEFLGEWNMGANGAGYQLMRLWQATDNCGNTTTGAQFIDVQDNGMPMFTYVPANLTIECDDLVPFIEQATAEDACDNVGVQVVFTGQIRIDGPNSSNYTLVRSWKATDIGGNTVTASQVIVVQDTQMPVFTNPPADVTVACGDVPGLPLVFATDNCDNYVPVVYVGETMIPGDDCNYSLERSWTVSDDSGHSTSWVQVVTVEDTDAPWFGSIPGDLNVGCGEVPPLVTPVVYDNCDDDVKVTLKETSTPGDCPGEMIIERAWTAEDDCGNKFTTTQTIVASDNSRPEFGNDCPKIFDFYTSDGGACPDAAVPSVVIGQVLSVQDSWDVGGYTVDGLVDCVTDDCSDAADLMIRVEDITYTGVDCDRVVIVTFRLIDACANESTKTFKQYFIIHDNIPPVFTSPPGDKTVDCEAPLPTPPAATDNCGGTVDVKISSNTTVPGDCYYQYTLIRVWKATDACGNTATVSEWITVQDNEAPVFTKVPPSVTINCDQYVPVSKIKAVDNCSGVAKIDYDGATVNYDACPYLMTRQWTARDYCGNTTTVTQLVTIYDTKPPVSRSSIPPSITVECGNIPAPSNFKARDRCDSDLDYNFDEDVVPGDCDEEYEIHRTWTASDDCGNTITRAQVIHVRDTERPDFSYVPPPENATCGNIPPVAQPLATDYCDDDVLVEYDGEVQSPGDCNSGYTLTRTWTASDNCGNTVSCTQVIFVLPNIVGNGPYFFQQTQNEKAARETEQRNPTKVMGEEKTLQAVLAPNPASQQVQVRFDVQMAGAASIALYDHSGRLVKLEQFEAAAGTVVYRLDIRDQAAGMYIVQVRAGNQTDVQKLIIQSR